MSKRDPASIVRIRGTVSYPNAPVGAEKAHRFDGAEPGSRVRGQRMGTSTATDSYLSKCERIVGFISISTNMLAFAVVRSRVRPRATYEHDRFPRTAVFLVPDPPAFRAQPFPGAHGWQRPNDRRLLPLPACFHAQDAEATFVVVEGDALDQPGNLLGRRPTLWGCRVHLWEPFSHARQGSWRGSGVGLCQSSGSGMFLGCWTPCCGPHYFFGYPTDCAKMIFCCGCNFRVLARAGLSMLARTTVASPSDAQYR